MGVNQRAVAREIMEWRSIPKIIVGPENSWSNNRAERAGIVFSFVVENRPVPDVVKDLDALGLAVRGGDLASLSVLKRMRVTATVRASCYAYTFAEEIDQLIAALQKNAEDSYDG